MFLRLTTSEFERNCPGGGRANRALLQRLVESGEEPGMLAYRGEEPVGWVAIAPREAYGRILRSPVHKPVDAADGVYAITCFFVARSARATGVADALLAAAVEFARSRSARSVEAYPTDVAGHADDASMWRGSLAQFERAGFEVIVRRKPARPIVRLEFG
jgi:GNAT superfamily N-acetyltransferase